ncbi:hypothetical protein JL720_2399 [Aureococcus anophagefferens]|nr:hypothetical protein JL720_2399 [Aureococcus anophagefferens]
MDQRQTQKSIQHAVKRVMELSSLKRTTRNLAEVIEQAMAECNSRASRDSNFAHLTSEQLQRAHEMHLKLCEKAGLKETPREAAVAPRPTTDSVSVASTSFLLILDGSCPLGESSTERTKKSRRIRSRRRRCFPRRSHAHRRRRMTRKNSRPPSVRDRENKREAEERYAAEEMLGMHAGACHLRDSPPEDREFALDMLVARAAARDARLRLPRERNGRGTRRFGRGSRARTSARDPRENPSTSATGERCPTFGPDAGRELRRARATRAKLRSRRPTSGSDARWAETVRELKKDRVRNARAIEKSWLMMEEEKRSTR